MRMILWIYVTVIVFCLLLICWPKTRTLLLSYSFTTEACAASWCANFTCYTSNQCGRNCVCAFEGNEQVGTCMRFDD